MISCIFFTSEIEIISWCSWVCSLYCSDNVSFIFLPFLHTFGRRNEQNPLVIEVETTIFRLWGLLQKIKVWEGCVDCSKSLWGGSEIKRDFSELKKFSDQPRRNWLFTSKFKLLWESCFLRKWRFRTPEKSYPLYTFFVDVPIKRHKLDHSSPFGRQGVEHVLNVSMCHRRKKTRKISEVG